jgi:predicted membrane protein
MSYCDLHPVSSPFRGGDLSAIMGGIKLDLRDAHMEGDQATLDVFAFWGGVEIHVPSDWVIASKVTTIIGGFVDGRRPSSVVPAKTLLIRGYNLMSGIEVKN